MSAPLRVTVLDAWDAIPLVPGPDETIAGLKRRALDTARVVEDPAAFEVKYLGAAIRDEQQTPATLGIPEGAGLIVLRVRRTAVR
jgi:hypothetical protein